MDKKQISGGLILSYLLIIVNCFYGLFITPFILSKIGTANYGVYQTIASFSASLSVVNLGIGSAVIRYVAYFKAKQDQIQMENYIAMAFIQVFCILLVLGIVSSICYSFIQRMFSHTFNNQQLLTAKILFVILIVNMGLNIIENVFFGMICGCNKFVLANSVKMMRILMRILLVFVLLSSFKTSIILVLIDTLIVILTILIEGIYIVKKLHIIPKLNHFDKNLFFESLKYCLLLFIQSIVIQFNGNIDNILIGAYISATSVSIYSIGLQLYNMFEQFGIAFSDLMLPTVTQQVVNNDNNTQLENTVIKVGRFQFIFLGAVLLGFIVLGKQFIILWVGQSFLSAWTVGLILMIPTIIPLIQNVCLSILRAKNKLGFRTFIITCMVIINFTVTFIGVKYLSSYIWAAIGTSVSLILANILAMNIYYYKILHINVFRIFKGVLSKTWICVLIPAFMIFFIQRFLTISVVNLLMMIIFFIVVYALSLWLFGLNEEEKNMIKGIVKR